MFDEDEMEEIRAIFLEESYEGLDVMESGLLSLDHGHADLDIINDIFRAAHSIKGGAGTFGFEEVAGFTHGVETLLDQMRDGERSVTQEGVDLLLQSVDCLREMLDAIRDHTEVDPARGKRVSTEIEAMLGSNGDTAPAETAIALEGDASDSEIQGVPNSAEQAGTPGGWKISYAPQPQILKTGNDPIHIFRELRSLGHLEITTNESNLPSLDEMDPMLCYLSWDLVLVSEASLEDIKAVFDWVEDEATIEIEPLLVSQTDETQIAAEDVSGIIDETPEEESVDGETLTETPADKKSPQLRVVPGVEDRRAGDDDRRRKERRSKSAPKESTSIRVDIDKIDALLNLVGELVITQSSLGRFRKDFSEKDTEELRDSLVQLERNTRELQESAMQIRMLPIKVTFSRFPRLVHDLSSQLNKKIELKLTGEGTELDKTVLEKIGDPLVHLVRNSIDHGIESPEDRVKAGKPEAGTIYLSAYHEAGNIVIEISDDGAGLNKDRILEKARQKGLVSEDATLTDEFIHHLIFQPGFSTAETITGVSGRGVGMDVVLRNIQDLNGRIDVRSEIGKGSTFTIRLPLTLAIIDGQLIRIGKDVYVIPLLSITETMLIEQSKLNLIVGKKQVYQFRDEMIPVIKANQVWDFAAETVDEIDTGLEDKLLMVLKSGNHLVGLVVDELLEQQQVVVKSLATNYRSVDGLSGATILGDGSVVLIVDVPGLVNLCISHDMPAVNNDLAAS